jgi:hypothetical protein
MCERRRTISSFGVIAVSLVAISVTSTAVDGLMHASGIVPVWFQPMAGAMFFLSNAYRAVINVAGCCLIARMWRTLEGCGG